MPKTTSTQTESQADEAIPLAAGPSEADKTAGPIEQALALRTALRETLIRTNNLITALKRQSKLVQSTLAALEELRSAG